MKLCDKCFFLLAQCIRTEFSQEKPEIVTWNHVVFSSLACLGHKTMPISHIIMSRTALRVKSVNETDQPLAKEWGGYEDRKGWEAAWQLLWNFQGTNDTGGSWQPGGPCARDKWVVIPWFIHSLIHSFSKDLDARMQSWLLGFHHSVLINPTA